MTRLEARIRRRLRPLFLQVFRDGELVFDAEQAVKVRQHGDSVRAWTYSRDEGVIEWWLMRVDEVRVWR